MLVCFLNCAAATKTYRLDLTHTHTHNTRRPIQAGAATLQLQRGPNHLAKTLAARSYGCERLEGGSCEPLLGGCPAAYSLDRGRKREREIESWKRTQRGEGGSKRR
jgi:hypothetical protein